MTKNKILYTGCSFTQGSGFDLLDKEPSLWVNQLHASLFPTKVKINQGLGGRSNAGIYQDTLRNLSNGDISVAIVSWTSMPRYEMDLGCELYDTRHTATPNTRARDHHLNHVHYPAKYLNDISYRFLTLAHLHREICNLIDYCNSLIKISKMFDTKIFFINAICPWDRNYFTKLEDFEPEQLTKFTKQLLNIDNRDDCEIRDLYTKIHDDYETLGGVHSDYWLNLYESMQSLIVDRNNDGRHPGSISNTSYAEMFVTQLKKHKYFSGLSNL